MLAGCVELTDPDDPATAVVDYQLAHARGQRVPARAILEGHFAAWLVVSAFVAWLVMS